MGILLGLATALGWGVSDFVARGATRVIGAFRTLFYMQLIGLIGLTAYLLATGGFAAAQGVSAGVWATAALVGVINVLSSLALFRAFQVGALVLVAPITASYSALTVALSLLSGEVVSPARLVGIVTVLIGVIGATLEPDGEKITPTSGLPPGVIWALLAALGYGVMFWVLGFGVAPHLNGLLTVWVIRVMSPALLALVALAGRGDLRRPDRGMWRLVIFCGVVDTIAYIAVSTGLRTEQVSIVTVLSSLYGAVTVLLACLILRERLRRIQWVGVVLIFVGILLVSA